MPQALKVQDNEIIFTKHARERFSQRGVSWDKLRQLLELISTNNWGSTVAKTLKFRWQGIGTVIRWEGSCLIVLTCYLTTGAS